MRKSTRWSTSAPVLDQLETSSCTGNAMAQWLNTDYAASARKHGYFLTEANALELYGLATRLDGIPNNTYPGVDEGSSGNAVAKAARQLGYVRGYSWTFSLNGFLAALQTQPLIVGTVFYAGMEDPDRHGLVRPTGALEGGHEYLILGNDEPAQLIEWQNSWGSEWGVGGRAFISYADFGRLLVDPAMPGDVTAPRL